MAQTDDEILRRVQRGERSEFIELFDRHYPRIARYARYQLQHEETAQDIASETFLRAYRNVDSFRIGEISFPGYLFLICRRLIITERQRQRQASLVSLDEMAYEGEAKEERIADGATLPLNLILDAEKRAMVREALSLLPPDDREIILLAFDRDLSRRDIAPILGKPTVSAVTSHLHRAMQKLKTALMRQGYFHSPSQTERETK